MALSGTLLKDKAQRYTAGVQILTRFRLLVLKKHVSTVQTEFEITCAWISSAKLKNKAKVCSEVYEETQTLFLKK